MTAAAVPKDVMVLGLGTWEILLAGLALLVFFGPEHAPQAIRALGRWRRRASSILSDLEEALDEEGGGRDRRPPPETQAWQVDPDRQDALEGPDQEPPGGRD
jgi:Sec-independent protein translocase protein TatA